MRLGESGTKMPPTHNMRLAGIKEKKGPPGSREGNKESPMIRLSSAGSQDGRRRPGSAAGANASKTDVSVFDTLFSDPAQTPAISKTMLLGESVTSNSALKGSGNQMYNMQNFTSSAALALRSKQEQRSRLVQKEATNVYDTYARQRKAFQNASQLASEMKTKVDDIADNQQLYGDTNNVDHGQLASEIEAQLQEHENRNAGSHNVSTDEADGGEGIEVGVNENEEEILDAQMRAKSKRIQKLRAMQRTLIGMDEAEEDERRKQHLAINRGRTADASVPGSHNAATNAHKTTAREVRDVFEGMFNEKHSSDLPPDPPTVFTTTALGSAIECINESLSTIIDATDVICVTATFKGKDESAVITPAVQALQKHIPYARRCYAIALSHLSHFESGERAVLEGGNAEINSLREQFLKRKEELSTEEQKEQVTLELLNGLKTRLLNQQKRVDLYEKMVDLYDAYAAQEIEAEHDLQEDSTWSITEPTYYYVNPRRRSVARSCSISSRSLASPQRGGDNDSPFPQDDESSTSQLRPTGGRISRIASRNYNAAGARFSSAVTPVQGNLPVHAAAANNGTNDNTAKSAVHTFLGQFLNPSAGGDGRQLTTSVEDRIASTWGNPYLKGQRANSRPVGEGEGEGGYGGGGAPPGTAPGDPQQRLTTEVAALLPLSKEEKRRRRSDRAPSEGGVSVASTSTGRREGRRLSVSSKTVGGTTAPTEEEAFIQERTVVLLQALQAQLNAMNANAESVGAEQTTSSKPTGEQQQGGGPPQLNASAIDEIAARKMTKACVQRLLRFLLSIKKVPPT